MIKNEEKPDSSDREKEYSADNKKSPKKSKINIFCKKTLLPCLATILGLICSALSIILIIAEMTLFLTEYNLSVFGYLIHLFQDSFVLILLFTMIPLCYMINTTMYSLFHLKLSGVYGIYKNKNTDAESLLILSSFMCRIAFPLGLNFIQIMKLEKQTIIQQIMGSTKLLPILGYKFTIIFPTILGILCIFNYFNIFGSLLSCIGLSSFGFENYATNVQITEGNLIFERSKCLI